jgi:hypothetical protein
LPVLFRSWSACHAGFDSSTIEQLSSKRTPVCAAAGLSLSDSNGIQSRPVLPEARVGCFVWDAVLIVVA